MTKLMEIEGIGEIYSEKLIAAGVKSMEQLLEMGASKKGRKELSEKSGIGEAHLLEWINRADLARIKGIGSEYADLLEAAGVDSVPELAMRNAEHLFEKMTQINEAKKLTRRMPTMTQVTGWIKEAKTLPRIVTH